MYPLILSCPFLTKESHIFYFLLAICALVNGLFSAFAHFSIIKFDDACFVHSSHCFVVLTELISCQHLEIGIFKNRIFKTLTKLLLKIWSLYNTGFHWQQIEGELPLVGPVLSWAPCPPSLATRPLISSNDLLNHCRYFVLQSLFY